MKKLYRILLCAACIWRATTTVHAQDNTDFTSPMWGIRAAFDINIPGRYHYEGGSADMFHNGYGFTLGAVYNIYLKHNFYIEPGISFFYDTYKYDITLTNSDATYSTANPPCHKLGLRIPVVAGYTFNVNERMSMTVFTGPELNIALKGRAKAHDEHNNDIGWNLFEEGNQHRVDLAWKIGIGFPIGDFMVSMEGAVGVTDLLRGSISFRENRASVGLTYYF